MLLGGPEVIESVMAQISDRHFHIPAHGTLFGGLCGLHIARAPVDFITLTEAGADFEVLNLNSRSGDLKKPEFLKLNPKHKVPVLIIDGEPLTDQQVRDLSFNILAGGVDTTTALASSTFVHLGRHQRRIVKREKKV